MNKVFFFLPTDDIHVVFFSEGLQWEAKGEFGPNDIHRQVCIDHIDSNETHSK